MAQHFTAELESQLFQAQAAEGGLGLVIRTNDPAEYLRRAYVVKKRIAQAAPEFEALVFKRSPVEPNRIWIIRAEALQQQSEEPTENAAEEAHSAE